MDINSKDDAGKTALHYAAQHNSVAVAQWLIEHGAAVDRDGYTPLHYASVRFDGMKMAELLVGYGANIYADNGAYGVMPFELANDCNNKKMAKYLINEIRWECFRSGILLTIDGKIA